jgi:hypothetical protein
MLLSIVFTVFIIIIDKLDAFYFNALQKCCLDKVLYELGIIHPYTLYTPSKL